MGQMLHLPSLPHSQFDNSPLLNEDWDYERISQSQESVQDIFAGSVLDEYQLGERIGSGGCAQVYRARHIPTGDLLVLVKAAPAEALISSAQQQGTEALLLCRSPGSSQDRQRPRQSTLLLVSGSLADHSRASAACFSQVPNILISSMALAHWQALLACSDQHMHFCEVNALRRLSGLACSGLAASPYVSHDGLVIHHHQFALLLAACCWFPAECCSTAPDERI